ncbi:SymE family type I addiction module toxin [Flavobacterium sp. CAU 1735]|uniref:SymE family type I addiction module toxin n=1 Tax=Flavobacterium sp. CAU 1735 TaxID=3140361 RepID=UPI0032617101
MKNSRPTKSHDKERLSQIRRITVYGKAFQRTYGRYVYYPEIRLAGKWLQDTGFKTRMKVKISYSYKKIIITVDTCKNTSLYR